MISRLCIVSSTLSSESMLLATVMGCPRNIWPHGKFRRSFATVFSPIPKLEQAASTPKGTEGKAAPWPYGPSHRCHRFALVAVVVCALHTANMCRAERLVAANQDAA